MVRAEHPLEDGYDIGTVQELLGREDVKTTIVYAHVLNRGPRDVRRPVDAPYRSEVYRGCYAEGVDCHAH